MQHSGGMQKLVLGSLIVSSALVIMIGTAWGIKTLRVSHSQAISQPTASAIGGFPMTGSPAPDFKLMDQFSRPVTLSSLRGREIVLAFIDARCTTLCPLTAQIMYNAKTQLGSSTASRIELVAINANPTATSITEVQSWSIQHGMLHQWLFLTGTAKQLQSVYHAYQVYDQVGPNKQSVHDPAMFIIDAQGHTRLYFETLDSSTSSDLGSEEIGLKDGMQQWLPQAQ